MGRLRQDAAIETLGALKALGIRIAIDDFGTGYSSLAYLQRFPIDALKIDRYFVSGPGGEQCELKIAQAVATLAASLGMDAVAEGVENARQRECVHSLGCRYGQGYFFSRPLARDAARALLVSAHGAPAAETRTRARRGLPRQGRRAITEVLGGE